MPNAARLAANIGQVVEHRILERIEKRIADLGDVAAQFARKLLGVAGQRGGGDIAQVLERLEQAVAMGDAGVDAGYRIGLVQGRTVGQERRQLRQADSQIDVVCVLGNQGRELRAACDVRATARP